MRHFGCVDDAQLHVLFNFKILVRFIYVKMNTAVLTDIILWIHQNVYDNKYCGIDLILNEFLKHSSQRMLPIFVKQLNIIFVAGIVPELWSVGVICT